MNFRILRQSFQIPQSKSGLIAAVGVGLTDPKTRTPLDVSFVLEIDASCLTQLAIVDMGSNCYGWVNMVENGRSDPDTALMNADTLTAWIVLLYMNQNGWQADRQVDGSTVSARLSNIHIHCYGCCQYSVDR